MEHKYNFIKLNKVTLRNFSLYKKKNKIYEVNEDINAGVYCLAGANGLGKTTFLNSINYGLTGVVLDPQSTIFSPSEIVFENKKYTDRYFEGRVDEKNRNKAEVEILISVNDKYFRIIRGFFEKDELRLLEIYKINNDKRASIFKSKNQSPKELCTYYQEALAEEIGFSSFDYFIFYQLYVLTFDETRRLIFWDDRASSNALAIAFNDDPDDAQKISDLLRRMDKHESNGRNARYQAKRATDMISELSSKAKGKKSDAYKIEMEFGSLQKSYDKCEKLCNDLKIEFDTLLKKQSYLNSEIMHLRIEHKKLFSLYSKPRSKLLQNTNIQLSIKKSECCLCNSHGFQIVENIERNVNNTSECPLCNTPIEESDKKEQNDLLKAIQKNDEIISYKTESLDNLIPDIDGKRVELEKAEYELSKIKSALDEITAEHPAISFDKTSKDRNNSLIEQYKKQFKLYDTESVKAYKARDALKPVYDKLLKKVEQSYKEAELKFVPTFKKLAKSFIGLELNIHPKRTGRTIKLVLELNDTARTQSFQLSESQRFFLDIALRMALSIFLSGKNGATMFIDTPEGSLDIAYESRVGNMFAQFVTTYNQNLFMTANINASQLLISLAENCGKEKMKFRRMLEWTDLTVIQKEGESLFNKVYSNIETALNSK